MTNAESVHKYRIVARHILAMRALTHHAGIVQGGFLKKMPKYSTTGVGSGEEAVPPPQLEKKYIYILKQKQSYC